MSQPLLENLEGGFDEELTYSTTRRKLSLSGTLPDGTVDVQVDTGNGQFQSDSDLVEFESGEFQVPDPDVYPEGLPLSSGSNTVRVRAILSTGEATPPAVAEVTVLSSEEIGLVVPAPTGLRVRRRSDAVELVWAASDSSFVESYNVWASTEPAGGKDGYRLVSSEPITEVSFQEENRVEATSTSATYEAAPNSRLRTTLIEEDAFGIPLSTVQDSVLDTSLVDDAVVTTTVESVDSVEYHSFVHDRSDGAAEGISNSEFWRAVPPDQPIYYVITATGVDPDNGLEVESNRSSELTGLPLVLNDGVREIQPPKRFEISRNLVDDILDTDEGISAVPGSTTRDVHIDPFASEAERLHFLADFVRRSQTFSTLLRVDDPDGDGESDPVSDSAYKQALKSALGIREDDDVQALIDDRFDQLAANHEVTREGAQRAIGQALFFTNTEPTSDLVVEEGAIVTSTDAEGTTSSRFRVTSRVEIPFDERQSYFDFQTDRWEVEANIEAIDPGESGNVPANQITTVASGTELEVNNPEPTRFGRDEESNRSLAERAILAFSSVDSGTGPGYRAAALEERGVFRTRIVKGQDPLMMRDWDPVREKHIGGKVDVWIQGRREMSVTERFALSFQRALNVEFELDSLPSELIFVVDDPRLTPSNPISKILGQSPVEQARGFGVRNATTGEEFDLTGYDILDYNRIQLNTSITQPSLSVNDTVLGDIRFLESDAHVLERQPVEDVDRLTRLEGDTLLEEGDDFEVLDDSDPLLEGGSVEDDVRIRLLDGDTLSDLTTLIVNDERHVLVGQIEEPLGNLGVIESTVRVFSLDRTTEYDGPGSSDPDFFVEAGDRNEPFTIERNPDGDIDNGEQVSIDYQHDENFEATYVVNTLVEDVQSKIERTEHATADALVKSSVSVPVVVEMTVVLRPDANQSSVDSELRTRIGQMLNEMEAGRSARQSDVVRVAENVEGVDWIVMPMARMARSDGAPVIRESVASDFDVVEDLGGIRIIVSEDPLNHPTIDGGGEENIHHGVFRNDQPVELADNYTALSNSTERAHIVGDDGLIIPGYSDDATLNAEGFDSDEYESERKRRTANRLFLSVDEQATPSQQEWSATYRVYGEQGSSDVDVSDVSFVELGDLVLTYRRGS